MTESRLRKLVAELPDDAEAAVAALGAFEFEPNAPKIGGYYEKESEDITTDSLEHLSGLAFTDKLDWGVYERFLDEYLRPGAKKTVKIKK